MLNLSYLKGNFQEKIILSKVPVENDYSIFWNSSLTDLKHSWKNCFNKFGSNFQNYLKCEELPSKIYSEYLEESIELLKSNKIYGLVNVVEVTVDELSYHLKADVYSTSLLNCIRYTPVKLQDNFAIINFIIYQIISTLENLHSNGLVHLQLTLDQIFINDRYQVKLALPDFNNLSNLLRKFSCNITKSKVASSPSPSTVIAINERLIETNLNDWLIGQLSNLDYLLYLNYLAGRISGDPNNHPMVPWITDFSAPNSGLRDLTMSKFRINKGDEQIDKLYEDQQDELNEYRRRHPLSPNYHRISVVSPMESPGSKSNRRTVSRSQPRLTSVSDQHNLVALTINPAAGTGSVLGNQFIDGEQPPLPHHVSDVLSELSYYAYMARVTPISVLTKYYRNKYNPEEFRWDMSKMFNWSPDECIPEFFNDARILTSMHPDMADIQLPVWCSTPQEFIDYHRSLLESSPISRDLHHWIDLQFGYKLFGPDAVASKNVQRQNTELDPVLTNNGLAQLFRRSHPAHFETNDQFNRFFNYNYPIRNPSINEESSVDHFPDSSTYLPEDYNPCALMDYYVEYCQFLQDNSTCSSMEWIESTVVEKSVLEQAQDHDILSLLCLITEIFAGLAGFNRSDYLVSSRDLPLRVDSCRRLVNRQQHVVPQNFRKTIQSYLSKYSNSPSSSSSSFYYLPSISQLKSHLFNFSQDIINLYNLQRHLSIIDIISSSSAAESPSPTLATPLPSFASRSIAALAFYFRRQNHQNEVPNFHIMKLSLSPYLARLINQFNILLHQSNTVQVHSQANQLDTAISIAQMVMKKFGMFCPRSVLILEIMPAIIQLYPTSTEMVIAQHCRLYQRQFMNLLLTRIGMSSFINMLLQHLIFAIIHTQHISLASEGYSIKNHSNESFVKLRYSSNTNLNLAGTSSQSSQHNKSNDKSGTFIEEEESILQSHTKRSTQYLDNVTSLFLHQDNISIDSNTSFSVPPVTNDTGSVDGDGALIPSTINSNNSQYHCEDEEDSNCEVTLLRSKKKNLHHDHIRPHSLQDLTTHFPINEPVSSAIVSANQNIPGSSQLDEVFSTNNYRAEVSRSLVNDKSIISGDTTVQSDNNEYLQGDFNSRSEKYQPQQHQQLNSPTEDNPTEESTIANHAADSLICLCDTIGPVLTTTRVVMQLLTAYNQCYIISEAVLQPITQLATNNSTNDSLIEALCSDFVTGAPSSIIQADADTKTLLHVIHRIVGLYGCSIVNYQLRHYLSHTIERNRNYISNYGALVGAINMIKFIVLLLPQMELNQFLMDRVLDEFLPHIIKVVGNLHSLPGSYIRQLLLHKTIDVVYLICTRHDYQQIRDTSIAQVLQLLFELFTKTYILDDFGNVFHRDNLEMHAKSQQQRRRHQSSSISKYSPTFLVNYKDNNSFQIKSQSDSVDKEAEKDSIAQPAVPSDLLPSNIQEGFQELKNVITGKLASVLYITFARLLGEHKFSSLVLNHKLIRALMDQHENQSMNISNADQSLDKYVYSPPDKIKQQLLEDRVDINVQMMMQYPQRHLSGIWNQYWSNEIGVTNTNKVDIRQMHLARFQGHATGPIKGLEVLQCENGFLSWSGNRSDRTVRLFSVADIEYNQYSGTMSSSSPMMTTAPGVSVGSTSFGPTANNVPGQCVIGPRFVYRLHNKPITDAVFLEQMRMAVSLDGTLHLWDPFVGKQILNTNLGVSNPSWSCLSSILSIPCAIACANSDGRLQLFDIRCGQSLMSFSLNTNQPSALGNSTAGDFASSMGVSSNYIKQITASPDGNHLLFASSEGYVSQMDIRNISLVSTWRPHINEITQMRYLNRDWVLTSSIETHGRLTLTNVMSAAAATSSPAGLPPANHNQVSCQLTNPELGAIHSLMILSPNEILAASTQNRFGLYNASSQSSGFFLASGGGLDNSPPLANSGISYFSVPHNASSGSYHPLLGNNYHNGGQGTGGWANVTKLSPNVYKGTVTKAVRLNHNRLLLLGNDNGGISLLY